MYSKRKNREHHTPGKGTKGKSSSGWFGGRGDVSLPQQGVENPHCGRKRESWGSPSWGKDQNRREESRALINNMSPLDIIELDEKLCIGFGGSRSQEEIVGKKDRA